MFTMHYTGKIQLILHINTNYTLKTAYKMSESIWLVLNNKKRLMFILDTSTLVGFTCVIIKYAC